VLAALAPGRRAVLVPLLLTAAYHGRVDVPAVVSEAAGLPISLTLAEVLGPLPRLGRGEVPQLLVDGLIRRLDAAGLDAAGLDAAGLDAAGLDAVVLAAAGTRDAAARETITWMADALSARLSAPCAVSYASAAPPLPGAAVAALRAGGAARVGVAAYFLAPGRLYDVAVRSALEAGAVAVAEPLGDAPELVDLVAARVQAALGVPLTAAA
jgi:sirohydrochlorin ferrochelatase